MGRKHRATVTALWAYDLRRNKGALLLAYRIADSLPDAELEWWGGQRWTAEQLGAWEGGQPWTDGAKKAAQRAVSYLVAAGFLERLTRASPGRPARYHVRGLKPPL